MDLNLPHAFKEKMERQLPEEHKQFFTALRSTPPVAIRLHPIKGEGLFPEGENIPWSSYGKYLQERPSFTLDPLLHAGAYYVQEASSQFLEVALQQSVDPSQPMKVLDLCAAPGGKSTLLQSLITRESIVVSNEVIRPRVKILEENMVKWGLPNRILTGQDPSRFAALPGYFDVILVDAPCSGEGLFRKDAAAAEEWSPANVQLCAGRQARILSEAVQALKEGGVLIYSTCTYEPEENERQVEKMVASGEFEEVKLEVNLEWNIYESSLGYRFYPHKVKGEGFYIAVLRKKAGGPIFHPQKMKNIPATSKKQLEQLQSWVKNISGLDIWEENGNIFALPAGQLQVVQEMRQQMKIFTAGVILGKFAGNDFIPGHDLAMSDILSANVENISLEKEQALQYLRRQDILGLPLNSKGWKIVAYEDRPLGWIKMLSNRINSYYPKEWRIRMQ